MKKIICIPLAILFYILGLIGLAIPVVPQIPFFIIGTVLLAIGSKSMKEKIIKSKFYKEHLNNIVVKNRILTSIFQSD